MSGTRSFRCFSPAKMRSSSALHKVSRPATHFWKPSWTGDRTCVRYAYLRTPPAPTGSRSRIDELSPPVHRTERLLIHTHASAGGVLPAHSLDFERAVLLERARQRRVPQHGDDLV